MPDPSTFTNAKLMFYENTTEGTPLSPLFSTIKAMASWLAENDGGTPGFTSSQWVKMIGDALARGGSF
jgi:hypothetical protein